MKRFLTIFDIDGTVAEFGKPVDMKIIGALRDLNESADIVFASGKNVSYIAGFVRGIGVKSPAIIGENGCVIFFPETLEEIIMIKRPDVISAIEREIMKKFDNQVWLQPNKVQLTIFPKQVNLLEEILKTLNDMIPEKERGNIKIFVHEDSIDLIPANIDKGVAVKKLREILNIDKDYVISVGDDENDIPMLIESGISISIGDKIKHYNPTHNFECVLDAIAFIKKVVTHE